MIERNIQSRIVNKHDIEKNWNKAVNFIPKKGEFIIYDIDENYDYPRLKVGDGATVVGQLPFIDSDVRNLIAELTIRLNALADSDDTTLDQLSEIVAYIKSNKDLISAITTDKVSVEDIVDNLTTNATNKPLSAAQGMQLKKLVDTKVDKVEGKGLSSNDYTDIEKTKLASIQEGAVSSWNDLNDKPFGEEISNLGDTLTYDGTPSRYAVSLGSVSMEHVSDSTPKLADLANAILTFGTNEVVNYEFSLSVSNVIPNGTMLTVVVNNQPFMLVAPMDGAEAIYEGMTFSFPKKGIYFLRVKGDVLAYTMSLKIEDYNFTKTVVAGIDTKYLPVGGVGYEENLSETGDTLVAKSLLPEVSHTAGDYKYVLVSEQLPTKEQLERNLVSTIYFPAETVDVLGNEEEGIILYTWIESSGIAWAHVIYEDGMSGFPRKGIYFLTSTDGAFGVYSLTIPGYGLFKQTVIHKIDSKFLPDTVATKADIIGAMEASY